MFGQISGLGRPHQNKEIFHIKLCPQNFVAQPIDIYTIFFNFFFCRDAEKAQYIQLHLKIKTFCQPNIYAC